MKRCSNIYSKVVSLDNLRKAHENARRNKTFYSEVKRVDSNPDYYLKKLQKQLINKTYKTSEYEVFTVNDKGKEREIYKLPYYPDRIVHWAIMQQIEGVFLNQFISQTYAAIPDKGIHAAFIQLDEYLKDREGTQYCLKIDVKKFFPSIDKGILKRLLRRKFKDLELLWLLDEIIDSNEKGIPIGNYLSQYFGNFYLSYFDRWIKQALRVKYYLRYMDDCVILHRDKEYLHHLCKDIKAYLNDNLNLILKEDWQVFPTFVRGVDFVGYRHFGDYVLLRKSTAKNFKRKLRRLRVKCESDGQLTYSEWCSINSYAGWIKWCNGYNLHKKYIDPLLPYTERYYREAIKTANSKNIVGNERHYKNEYNGVILDLKGNVIDVWFGDSRGGVGYLYADIEKGKIDLQTYVNAIKQVLSAFSSYKAGRELRDNCKANMNEYWADLVGDGEGGLK